MRTSAGVCKRPGLFYDMRVRVWVCQWRRGQGWGVRAGAWVSLECVVCARARARACVYVCVVIELLLCLKSRNFTSPVLVLDVEPYFTLEHYLERVCMCVCARARARPCATVCMCMCACRPVCGSVSVGGGGGGEGGGGVGGANGCIPLIMLVDVCQCCCLQLMFVCLPLLGHLW